MTVNRASLELIKEFEGWRSKAYRDAVGVLTIGYGHTSMAGAPNVVPGMTISQEEGERILQQDLRKYAKAVRDVVKVPLNDNQFGALVSWCYNVGPGNVAKSTLVKKLNRGEYAAVPGELMKWNKAGGKALAGLTRRRTAEGVLFRAPDTALAPQKQPVEAVKPIPAPVEAPKVQTPPVAPPVPVPAAPEHWLIRLLKAIFTKGR